MKITTYYPWEDRKDVCLTGYLLHASEQYQVGVKKPAVIVCPGGAYLKVSDQEAECVALRFAANGYHAFVLTYSVGEACKYPTTLLEIAKSILHIRQHADEWLVDENRIAVCGFSAGGHLCATISTQYKQAAELLGVAPEAVRPDAAILGYPVTDLTMPLIRLPLAALSGPVEDPAHPEDAVLPMFRCCIAEDEAGMYIDLSKGMNGVYIGTPTPTQEQLRAHSPLFHVGPDTPPTYLWTTWSDEMVSPVNSLAYAEALVKNGVKAEMHMFVNGPHGLSVADHTSTVGEGYENPEVAHWVPMVMDWFRLIWG